MTEAQAIEMIRQHSPKSVTWRELHSLRVHLEQTAAQLVKESRL